MCAFIWIQRTERDIGCFQGRRNQSQNNFRIGNEVRLPGMGGSGMPASQIYVIEQRGKEILSLQGFALPAP